jgi:hypothetical protein
MNNTLDVLVTVFVLLSDLHKLGNVGLLGLPNFSLLFFVQFCGLLFQTLGWLRVERVRRLCSDSR